MKYKIFDDALTDAQVPVRSARFCMRMLAINLN